MKKFMGMIWPTDTTPRGGFDCSRWWVVSHLPEDVHGGLLDLAHGAHEGRAAGGVHLGHDCDLRVEGGVGTGQSSGGDGRRRPAWREKCEDSAIPAAGRRATGARCVTAPRPRRDERPRAWLITPAGSRRSRESTRHGAHWRRFPRGGTAGLDTSHEPTVLETHAPSGSPSRGALCDALVRVIARGVSAGSIGMSHAPLGCRADGRRSSRDDLTRLEPALWRSARRRWISRNEGR